MNGHAWHTCFQGTSKGDHSGSATHVTSYQNISVPTFLAYAVHTLQLVHSTAQEACLRAPALLQVYHIWHTFGYMFTLVKCSYIDTYFQDTNKGDSSGGV